MAEKNKKRQLAAILFADIVGYTALMQKDEQTASTLLRSFQKNIEQLIPENNGQIINFYGDGALCIFNNPLEAVRCAVQLQNIFSEKPKVPVRLGLHMGTVVFENEKIYGDSVNIASRIESMGIPGAVLFSKKIRDEIKNQPDIKIKSLGNFSFKNVEEEMEVFALANEGFVIPKREEIKGKLKDASGSFFQKIWKKKIPQILIAYILLAWLGLQLFDWALNQFGISPHWAQIFFVTIIGLIPSLLVYLNNRERIHSSHLNVGEKILFPSNLLLVVAVLFFMFRSVDLGAISKNITFLNADGIEVTETIIKEEFRKRFPVFPFDPIKKDSINTWIGFAAPSYISYKLNQNKYLSPDYEQQSSERIHTNFTKVEKIHEAKSFNESFYIDGQYQVIEDQYEIIPALRNKKTGTLIIERRFVGNNLFALLDSIGNFLSENVGLSSAQLAENPNLSVQEALTDNLEAFKLHYIATSRLEHFYRNMEKAIELDSSFAYAAIALGMRNHRYGRGELETRLIIEQAMRHRKRLPLEDQMRVRVYQHIIDKEWERAEQLLKIQLEIDSNNEAYNQELNRVYNLTSKFDKIVKQTKNQFNRNPNPSTAYQVVEALLLKGMADKAISRAKTFLKTYPQNIDLLDLLSQAYIMNNELDAAKATIERIILIDPDVEPRMSKTTDAIKYLKTHPIDQQGLAKFTGKYRAYHSEEMVEFNLLAGLIQAKAANQGSFFVFPAGENLLKRGTPTRGLTFEYLLDGKGKIYLMKADFTDPGFEWNNYYWKQDSIIWNAEALLKSGDYANARLAYQKAIEQHPEHFYLHKAQQHIDYMQANSEEAVLQNFQKWVGQYGEIEIWMENGLLFYKRPGIPRRIFRPISDNRFTSLLNYSFNYEFVERNGKVVGIQGHRYNYETKAWEKAEDWYYERTPFLD